jgi:RNA methyltransferase, TrmH family
MPERITSPQNPRVKLALQLRSAGDRRKEGLTRIDGLRELTLALRSGVVLHTVFVTDLEFATTERRELQTKIDPAKIFYVPPPLMDKLQYGERTTEILAVVEIPNVDIDRIHLGKNPLIVVLDQAEKPGNIGAVLRSADAAGASAVILSDPACDLFNPNVIRASQGTIFTVPLASATATDTLAWLNKSNLQILAARVDAKQSLYSFDLNQATALVFGSESKGLGEIWSSQNISAASLPLLGQADSLNLSNTAAVFLYESVRQRLPK